MGFLDNLKINSKYHFYAIGVCYLILWIIYYKNFYHGSHNAHVEVDTTKSEEHTGYMSNVNFYIVSNEQWLVSMIYFMLGLLYLHHAFSSGGKEKSE
jgi:hypothetical protein